jgi:hypothetical protein
MSYSTYIVLPYDQAHSTPENLAPHTAAHISIPPATTSTGHTIDSWTVLSSANKIMPTHTDAPSCVFKVKIP